MREIKFRRPILIDGKFDHFSYWGVKISGSSFVGPESGTGHKEDEQYTSLKDRNGKDIYEGDLVRNFLTCNYALSKSPPIYEVVFKDAGFGFLADSNHGEYNMVSNKYRPGELTKPDNWEIIGNIHQNPELIK